MTGGLTIGGLTTGASEVGDAFFTLRFAAALPGRWLFGGVFRFDAMRGSLRQCVRS
jgi:hypothetical protein